jgi:hypothetical protein
MQYFLNISLIFHSCHTEREELRRYVSTYLVVLFLNISLISYIQLTVQIAQR